MNNKGLYFFIMFLVILLIISCISYYGFTKLCKNTECVNENVENNGNSNAKYSNNNISGYYRYDVLDCVDINGNECSGYYSLTLSKDGYFDLKQEFYAVTGNIGTYTISGNVIHLNYLLQYGSGYGYSISKEMEEKDIIISSVDSIVDNNRKISHVGNEYNTMTYTRVNELSQADIENHFKSIYNTLYEAGLNKIG